MVERLRHIPVDHEMWIDTTEAALMAAIGRLPNRRFVLGQKDGIWIVTRVKKARPVDPGGIALLRTLGVGESVVMEKTLSQASNVARRAFGRGNYTVRTLGAGKRVRVWRRQ
jgi:hypothetical protein